MAKSVVTGLDISTSCVRAAELSFNKGGVTLERFGQMPLPQGAVAAGEVRDPKAVAEAISFLWREVGFKQRVVSIGVSNQRVVVRQVDIPWVPKDDRRKSLPLTVADQIPMPVDQAVLDFVPLERVEGVEGQSMLRGLLVAAAEDSVLASVAAAEAAGLHVHDIDLTPFAIVRALVNADPLGMQTQAEAIIDVGAATTNVVIHVNGIPQFVRILMMGGQDITDQLMLELGVNLPTAESMKREGRILQGEDITSDTTTPTTVMTDVAVRLVEELRGSLDYYLATGPVERLDRIVLTGGGGLVRGFAEQLEQATGLPVARGAALSSIGAGSSGLGPEHLVFADPLSAAAVGLAIRDDQ